MKMLITRLSIITGLLCIAFFTFACGPDSETAFSGEDVDVKTEFYSNPAKENYASSLKDSTATDTDSKFRDDFLAIWPQGNVEVRNYDESPSAGTRRQKAEEYDDWHLAWHQPDHGSCIHAFFTDDNYTEISGYHGLGDSTIWTGTYLGSQSLRYWVTGEAQAKQNAIDKVHTLSGHLHVTGRTGFISRFWGSQSMLNYYGGLSWCQNEPRCHLVDTGPYTGDFWIGETSRDQYTGWFYGMALAYDLIDDEPTRDIIRDDVAEVLDELINNYFWILDEAGLPTDAAPNVLPPMQLSWLTIGYHITGLDWIKTELKKRLLDSNRISIQLNSIAFFNRYSAYFGNNLAHTNWYNLLRLGKEYFSRPDYNFLLSVFEDQVHTFTRLSHNPWFTAIFMGQGDYTPGLPNDSYKTQVEEDLEDFRPAPLGEYYVPEKDPANYTLDPVSVFLTDLQADWPFLTKIFGTAHYQALEPFTVDQYCPAGFMFQWSPYNIRECGADNPTKVHSGHDFLAAYWMASYHKVITKDQ